MEHRTKKHIMNSFVIWHKTKALPEQRQQGKEGLGETCHTLHRSLIPGDEEALHSPPRGTSKAISKVASANMRATPWMAEEHILLQETKSVVQCHLMRNSLEDWRKNSKERKGVQTAQMHKRRSANEVREDQIPRQDISMQHCCTCFRAEHGSWLIKSRAVCC